MASKLTYYDDRITKLATEVTDSQDRQLSIHLFTITDILNSAKNELKTSVELRGQLWDLGVLSVLNLVLKHDYSLVGGDWGTAAKLSSILSNVCCGLSLPDTPEYQETFLASAVHNIFLLARRIHNVISTETDEKKMVELQSNYDSVIEALTVLISGHIHLTRKVLESPYLLQLLISDDSHTALSSLSLILSIFRVNTECFSEVTEETRHNVMDELVYKVTVNTDPDIARTSVKCILRLCECYRPLVELMCVRYRGLRPLLRKWDKQGFPRQLTQLIQLLDLGNADRAANLHLHIAATALQCWWRGTQMRRKLKRANSAFAKFQKSYRGGCANRLTQWEDEWQQVQLERQMKVKRRRLLREFHEKQMQILEILPAAKIPSYFDEEERVAATKIQRVWKGHHERQNIEAKRIDTRQYRAAVCLQRVARRWLARCEARHKRVKQWHKPPGLTDERRVELNKIIAERHDMYPPKAQTEEERIALHNKTQDMLARYLTRGRVTRNQHNHREALLARLETDSQLLQYAPPLDKATAQDVDMYSSRSVPVTMKAKQNHNAELRLLRQPWWRKLGDEYQDTQYEEEDMMLMF